MWWQERAARYLREERYNTLLECAFRESRTVMDDASRFAHAQYRTHVSALAVRAALSRLGIIERFAAQVAATGTGRWTTAASHDADYVGTSETVRLAEASPDVSRISLWTRDGLIFDSSRSLAGGPAEGRPVELLAEARDTPLTRLQRVALAERLAQTLARLEAAGMAHRAAYEMADEVERDLGVPLAQLSAWRRRSDAAASSESSSTRHPEPEAG